MELAAQHGLPLLLGMHASDTDKAVLIGHYNRVAGTTGQVKHIAACTRLRRRQPA